MSKKQSLFTGTKSIPLEAYPEEAWTTYGGVTWPRPSRFDIQKIYRSVGLLWRCIDIRMASISNVPWEIRKEGAQGDKPLKADALTDKPTDENRPQPKGKKEPNYTVVWSSEDEEMPDEIEWFEDFPVLLQLSEASLCLRSEAFWFKLQNRVRPLGLQWLSPLTTSPYWDIDNAEIMYFQRSTKRYMPEEIVYLWQRDPMQEIQPRPSPVEAAMNAAGVLYNVDQFVQGFFERGAIKATLLTVEGNPNLVEKERLKAWWDRAFRGVRQAWSSGVVSVAVTPVVVGEGIAELSNTELTGEKRSDLVATLGIPQSKIFSDAANYATAQQDDKSFYRDTILPDCNLFARQINKQLLQPLGYKLVFTPETMDVFQADENERSQSFTAYVNAGIKPSIVAQILGLDLPEGIEYDDLDPEDPDPALLAAMAANPAMNGEKPAPGAPPFGAKPAAEDKPKPTPKDAEAKALRVWLKKRGADADVAQFETEYLKRSEVQDIYAETYPEKALRIIPRGTDEPRPPIPMQLDITDDDVERIIELWDNLMPDYAGLLEAEVQAQGQEL